MNPYKTHGAFSWQELMTSDPSAAARFYGAVLGWTSKTQSMPQGDYHLQSAGGPPIAGIMALPHEPMPSVWVCYISVDDVDRTVAKAASLGGRSVVDAMDVPGVGRMAALMDPQGAYFEVITWAPMVGSPEVDFAESFGRHGAFSWFQLQTTDPEAACTFYSELLGWEIRTDLMGGGPYHVINVAGAGMGGIMSPMGGAPPHWDLYVTVDDCDATAGLATEHGGTVLVPPTDIPAVGRFALIQDPTGARLNVIRYVPMEQG